MSNIDLNVDVGQTKTLTFNTKDKYNSEDIVFNISATDTLAAWAKAATKPSYTWSEINNKPTFATVATSGSYNDLTNKPSLNYLPLAGGIMTGNLDMGGKQINNGVIYNSNIYWGGTNYAIKKIIDTLLTNPGNRFAATPGSAIEVEYSRDGGATWVDYELTDLQKSALFTTQFTIYLGKRISSTYNTGLVDVANDRLRITYHAYHNNKVIFYGTLMKLILKSSISFSNSAFQGELKVKKRKEYVNNTDNWILLSTWSNNQWPGDSIINNINFRTSNGRTDSVSWLDMVQSIRFEFSYTSTTTQPTTQYVGGNVSCIYGFGDPTYNTPSTLASTGHVYNYDSQLNATFPEKVTSQEPINYDAIIKPTQSGNTVTKTNNWVLQYLTQGVHWLRDNKVETNSAASLNSLNIKGIANSAATINASTAENLYLDFGGVTPLAVGSSPLRVVPGTYNSNQVNLGLQNQYWKEVWAGKYIVPNGTSSQFLKADGSVDSTSYLPLAGGTMSGAIDMNKNSLKTAGFEGVTALPTTNLFAGRKVVMNGVEYTYNGNLWTSQLDPLQKYDNNTDGINTPLTTLNAKTYEIQLENYGISQIPQLLANNSISLTNGVLQSNEYIYERMDNGTTEWVETTNKMLCIGDKLRFTAWKDWETNVSELGIKNPGSINCIYLSINKRKYKMKVTIEYLIYTNALGDANFDNSANYTWWKVYEKEFPEQKNTWIFPLQRTIYQGSTEGGADGHYYIQNVRITIESITAGTGASTYFTPYISIYTSKQITPTTVPININYDAKIKPTQTTTTYKTNSWILQYLTQGVHWLRDNKVETNSDATLNSLNIKDASNNQVDVSTTPSSLIAFSDSSGNIPFVIRRNTLEIVPGQAFSNQISLGLQNQYWKEVWAGKYIVPNGTSSQFLKADGSVDSSTYATLDSTGKVPTSQLPVGIQGADGSRGVQGYQGIKGEDGTSVKILGTKDSTSQLPLSGNVNGDGYIIGDNLYVWDGSTWTNVGTIKGPQGVQGYQGIKGTDGTNGTNGVQGYQGYQGKSGVDGVQGFQGLQGKNGTNGTNGTTGAQGYQGYQGYTGLQGTTGSKGSNGTQGAIGTQGYQGYKGATGIQGFQGIPGLTGNDGAQGYQGFQGPAGTGGASMEENTGICISTTGSIVASPFGANANTILLDSDTNGGTSTCVLGYAARAGMDFSVTRNIVIDLRSLTSQSSPFIYIFPDTAYDLTNVLNFLPGVRYNIYLVNLNAGTFRLPISYLNYSHNGVTNNMLGVLGNLITSSSGLSYMQYGDSAKIEFCINDATFTSTDAVRVDITFDHNGEIGNRGTITGTTDTNPDNIPQFSGTKKGSNIAAFSATSLEVIQSFVNYCQSNTKSFSGMECIANDKNTRTVMISNADLMSLMIQTLINAGLIKM